MSRDDPGSSGRFAWVLRTGWGVTWADFRHCDEFALGWDRELTPFSPWMSIPKLEMATESDCRDVLASALDATDPPPAASALSGEIDHSDMLAGLARWCAAWVLPESVDCQSIGGVLSPRLGWLIFLKFSFAKHHRMWNL